MKLHIWQFQTFSQFKNWFLAIFEIATNGVRSKKIFGEIDLFDFTSFFFAWTFLNFLAHCEVVEIGYWKDNSRQVSNLKLNQQMGRRNTELYISIGAHMMAGW